MSTLGTSSSISSDRFTDLFDAAAVLGGLWENEEKVAGSGWRSSLRLK